MGNSPLTDGDGPRTISFEPERDGESRVFRSALAEKGLVETLDDSITTLYEVFKNSVDSFPNRKCLGWRENDGPYNWLNYKTAWSRIKNVGSGLLHIKCVPNESKVGIYSINRAEWVITEQACNAYSLCLVPLYDSLGPQVVSFILEEAEISIVVCTSDKTKSLLNGNLAGVKTIVQMGELTLDDKKKADELEIELITFDGLESTGRNYLTGVIPPKPDDIATICYTSGTTGNPKGVLLTHKNFVSELAGVTLHGVKLSSNDVHISYLPLAHVFERMIVSSVFANGGSVGFYRGTPLQLFEDIELLKPTIFASVPRVFNRIFDKVQASIKGGGIKQSLFEVAYDSKIKSLNEGYVGDSVWDTLVFGKVAGKLGGKVRLMITGSAPINAEVLKFLRIGFSCPVLEGYGQTETCAGATLTAHCDLIPGHVGTPLPCIEVKLVDVPEMNYLTSDENPRGEICFRGPCCTSGYYKNKEKTEELIDEHGWLHSGDVGQLLEHGCIKIIDRKKNIFKLSIGEYIAPEKLELIYGKSLYVQQIFVFGDSLKSKLIAIVVPEFDQIKILAKEHNLDTDNMEDICKNDEIIKAVLDDINKVGKADDVRGFERIHAIHMSPTLFTIEEDLLTPTFKLKRPQAKNKFNDIINQLYDVIGD
jgi:long-chain acyl-CoA synthetase